MGTNTVQWVNTVYTVILRELFKKVSKKILLCKKHRRIATDCNS